jgi:UDP-N-acetylmuramyl pentapeptide phosphotransferase/UDP-N-acetylglucosamine-1-phosphate transferase
MFSLLTLAISSFLLWLLLTPLVRNFSVRRGWVDNPDSGRKAHRWPVPRTGGVALVAAFVGAYGVLLLTGLKGSALVELDVVWRLAPAVAIILPLA